MFANATIRGVRVPCAVLYIVVILVIIVYGIIIRATGAPDILERKIIDHPSVAGTDGWAMTHLLFFGLLGFLYPGRYVQFMTVGIVWELIETLLGQTKLKAGGSRIQLIGAQDESGYHIKDQPEGMDGGDQPEGMDSQFWYGRLSDCWWNVAGYIIGSYFGLRA